MIRWSYLLTRVAIASTVALIIMLGLPPLAKWIVIRGIQTMTHSCASAENAWVWPAAGKMRLDHVQIARNTASTTNLFECRSATVSLNLWELARHRMVIDMADVRGIQLNTDRSENVEPAQPLIRPGRWLSRLAHQGNPLSQQWLDRVARGLRRRVEDEFTSVQMTRVTIQRWSIEYHQLIRQVDRCRQRAEKLHGKLSNPLDMVEVSVREDVLTESKELLGQLQQLRARIQQIPTELTDDRAAIQKALDHDRQRLHQIVQLVPLDHQQLNDSLLADEFKSWWDQLQPYVEVIQRLSSQPPIASPVNRGTLIALEDESHRPSFLIRKARLDGRLGIGNQDIRFIGEGRNLTTDLTKLTQPATIRLTTLDQPKAMITLALDHLGSQTRRQLTIATRDLRIPNLTWGRADALAISIEPHSVDLSIELMVIGERLEGQVRLAGYEVRLLPTVAPHYATSAIQQQLSASMTTVQRFVVIVDVSGTLDAPNWQIHSDLGKFLQTRLHRAFQDALDLHAQQLTERANQQIDDAFQGLREQWVSRLTEITRQLDIGRQLLAPQPGQIRLGAFSNLLKR